MAIFGAEDEGKRLQWKVMEVNVFFVTYRFDRFEGNEFKVDGKISTVQWKWEAEGGNVWKK